MLDLTPPQNSHIFVSRCVPETPEGFPTIMQLLLRDPLLDQLADRMYGLNIKRAHDSFTDYATYTLDLIAVTRAEWEERLTSAYSAGMAAAKEPSNV